MRSPFPGMDPYLEGEYWRGFHNMISVAISQQINPQIVPKYIAVVEVHSSVEEVNISTIRKTYPDVSIYPLKEEDKRKQQTQTATLEAPIRRTVLIDQPYELRSVNIYRTENKELVTAIEVLSPANKRGRDLRQYRRKRDRILNSATHLIEIDLLRGGTRPGNELDGIETDYLFLVNRASRQDIRHSDIWTASIAETLPTIPIPLADGDADAQLDCQQAFERVYEENYFYLTLDYDAPVPAPQLRPETADWWQQRKQEWEQQREQ